MILPIAFIYQEIYWEAADTAVNGVPFSCDVGVFNDDYFIYIAAFGLFTDVSMRRNRV